MGQNEVFGEPIALRAGSIHFTSWKYIRQGNFRYDRHGNVAPAGGTDPLTKALYSNDGNQPATFTAIDIPEGVRLVAQKAEKDYLPGDTFSPGKIITVLKDGDKFKAWYVLPPCPAPEPFSTKHLMLSGHDGHVAYAESTDGIHWDKPSLGLIEYAGSLDNNVVLRNDLNGSIRGLHGGSVFIDPSSEDERYKMVHLGVVTDKEWGAFAQKYPGEINPTAHRLDLSGGFRYVTALFGAVSPDGIHWRELAEPLLVDHVDTQNTCCYDPVRKLYVAYVRTWQVDPKRPDMIDRFPDSWINIGRRSIGRAISNDFRHFTRPEIIIATSAAMLPSHLWYTNCKTTLPGCDDQHVMFPWRWELECDGGDCFLFSSADGWHWSQVPDGPVLTRGASGAPDGGYIIASPHLMELPGQRWGIPFEAYPIPHKYPGRNLALRQGLFPGVPDQQGYGIFPKGRLVALDCPKEGGFATVGMMPQGNRLRINASIAPTGFIRVAVADMNGKTIPGRDFESCELPLGNALAMPVTWQGDPSLGHGDQPIILRFRMRQAQLFGIEFQK